jgi:hypothetical protein
VAWQSGERDFITKDTKGCAHSAATPRSDKILRGLSALRGESSLYSGIFARLPGPL